MQIDWFTFGAQVFNFVLLVWLLKRFLYRPVLDAIERREDRIRSHMEEARRRESEAEEKARELRRRREELEERRAEMVRQAEEEATERRRELGQEVREEIRTMREEWHESLRREKETFLEELRRKVSDQMYAVARRVLEDLADADLEHRIVRVFVRRLEDVDPDRRERFLDALEASDGRARIRSAFPIEEEARAEVEDGVRRWAGTDVELHFEEDPELGLGIELRAADRKVAWSVDSYLETLRADTAAYLEAEVR